MCAKDNRRCDASFGRVYPFDGNRLLGLDVLGLRGVAQRHVMRRSPDAARAPRAAARWPRSGARGGVVSHTRRWASRPRTCGCGAGAMSAAHISFLVGYSTPLNVQRRSPPRPLVPMALAHLVLPVVGQVLQRSLELAPYVHAQGAGVCVRGRHAATQYVGSCEMIGGRTNGTGNRPHMSP